MRFGRYYRSIRDYNLFDSRSNDPLIIRHEKWSTRLYILTLSLAIVILLFYNTLHVTTSQWELENPSIEHVLELYQRYPNLRCPCTSIATTYDRFLRISADYHPICSSRFVSNAWIESLFDPNLTPSRYAVDLRATISHQFQVLRELCRLAMETAENGLKILSNGQLISGQLLSKDLFEAQIQADISAFHRMIAENFARELTLVRSLIFGNQLMPAIPTAFTLIVRSDIPGVIRSTPGINTNSYRSFHGNSCWCTDQASCHVPAGFYDLDRLDLSRGVFDQIVYPAREYFSRWFSGCWPMETLLLSHLETFFHEILPTIDQSRNSSTWNESLADERRIEELVKDLFIRSLDKQWNYSAYFDQCHIEFCSIDVNDRASFLYIVTSLLGLYGGLSIALLFLAPTCVHLVMKTIQRDRNQLEFRRFGQSIQNFGRSALELNLFKCSRNFSPRDLQHQRWSTRLYLLSLVLALLFLTLYTSLSVDSKIVHVKHPSLTEVQQLQRSSVSLECPCTSLSITYNQLIELLPEYHQVCSSEFVTEKWIEGLSRIASLSRESLYFADFRYASPIFQLLKSLCQLANQTIINALFAFGQTQLVTANLLPPTLFEQQLQSAIEEFKRTTPNALLHLLQLTRNFTYMNLFLTGSLASFYANYSFVEPYAQPIVLLGMNGATRLLPNGTSDTCSCANDIQCGRNAALYVGPSGRRVVIYTLPGFYTRCFPVESLLPSTLECFYDTSPCLMQMATITNETFFLQLKRLNASATSRFRVNSTIHDLLVELFVESWSSKLFYPSYFSACQPLSCSHTVLTRKSTVEMVTTITGLIGGLSVAFRLLIPQLVALFAKLFERCSTRERTAEPPDDLHLRQKIWLFIINLNIFEKKHRVIVDESEMYLQRQSTRFYFVCLSIALFILIVYTSLTYQNHNYTVSVSSLAEFRQLQRLYGSTAVDCPCTQLSFNRDAFYQIDAKFHPICSSDFIKTDWLDFLFNLFNRQTLTEINTSTLLATLFTYFQSLRLICDLTHQAVIDARDLFLANDVVLASMFDEEFFNRWTGAALNAFQSTISKNFLHSLDMLVGTAQGNGLISAYGTNWRFFLLNLTKDATIYAQSKIYNRCNCATSITCIDKSNPELPGFFVGCLPIIALLHSTLECFYNQSCLNTMFGYLNTSHVPLRVLDRNSSRFGMTVKNSDLINNMFIESWLTDVSYERFFNQCRPMSCRYVLIAKYNLLYVATTIVGLYGGLTVFLKIIVPFVVERVYRLIRYRRRQIGPQGQRF